MPGTSTKDGRGTQIDRLVRLVDELLRNERLNTADVVRIANVGPAQARRYLHSLEGLKGVRPTADGLQFSKEFLFVPATHESVIASSLMGGVAALFRGTRYEQGMRDAVAHVVSHARQPFDVDSLRRKFHFATRGGDPTIGEHAEQLERLVQAIMSEQRVELQYRNFDGRPSRFRIDPLTLLIYEHQLYVVGRRSDGSFHAWRLARVLSVKSTKQQFTYPTHNEYDLDRFLGEVWGVFVDYSEQKLTDVVVRFSPKWRAYVENHRWHPSQHNIPDKTGCVRFHLRPCPEFERWILGLGAEIEVLEPAWLQTRIAEATLASSRRVSAQRPGANDVPPRRRVRAPQKARSLKVRSSKHS